MHRRNTSWAHALCAEHCSLPCMLSCGICSCCLHTPATLIICNDSKCCICNAGGGQPVSTEPAQACVPQPHLFRLLALSVHQMQATVMQTVSFQLFLWVLGISSLHRSITKCILMLCMVVHQMYVGSHVQQQLYVDTHVGYASAPSLQQSCLTSWQVSVRERIVRAIFYRYDVLHVKHYITPTH